MKLTDSEAIKALKKVNILELEENVEGYPEDEREGQTDWEIIAYEAGYMLDMFSEDTVLRDDLIEARQILSKTKYGKVLPLDIKTLKPIYNQCQIMNAKHTVNEYNRLVRFVKRLKSMGYCY